MRIIAERITLHSWRETHRHAFAMMHSDSEVMRDAGGPLSRAQSDAKFDNYAAAFGRYGYGRWAIESPAGDFLGYAGVMPSRPDHPLGPHAEIGWRLVRSAWGHGYATEAAAASLHDIFARVGLKEVLAYTAPDNLRSQAVMKRLRLQRYPSRDYISLNGPEVFQGLVWVARRPDVNG